MGAVYRAHHVLLRRPTAIKLLLPDRVGADNLERFEREVQHDEPAHAPEHRRGLRLRPQPRRRASTTRWSTSAAASISSSSSQRTARSRPARVVAHPRAGLRRAPGGARRRPHPPRHQAGEHHPVRARRRARRREGRRLRARQGDHRATPARRPQVILGTPAYIAPEAVTDPEHVGPAVDLYALGAVGYFLLTGRRVFEGKTAVDVCVQHVTAGADAAVASVDAIAIAAGARGARPAVPREAPGDRVRRARAALATRCARCPSRATGTEAEARRVVARVPRASPTRPPTPRPPTMTITVDLGHRDVRSA